MGGGSSVNQAVSILTDNLSLEILLQFVKYEAECTANGFSASETFQFLLAKHEEYLSNLTLSDNCKVSKYTKRPILKCFSVLSSSEMTAIVMSTSCTDELALRNNNNTTMNDHVIQLLDQVFLDPGDGDPEDVLVLERTTNRLKKVPKYSITVGRIRYLNRSNRLQRLNKHQLLWGKVFGKVVHLNLKLKLKERIEKMCFIPNHVRLLYSGSKQFFRHNITLTVDLRFYYHTLSHCVEIVSHLIHISASNCGSGSETPVTGDDALTEKNGEDCFLALPRIYLNHASLLGCVLGTQRRNSGILPEDLPTSSSPDGKKQKDVSVYRTRSLEKCLSGVMATFIHSHLKMTKPRRMSNRAHGLKRMGTTGGGMHVNCASSSGSFRDLSENSIDTQDLSDGPLSPVLSPVSSRSSSPAPELFTDNENATVNKSPSVSPDKAHAHSHTMNRSKTTSSLSLSGSSDGIASSSSTLHRSTTKKAPLTLCPLSPQSSVTRSGIAFDSPLSPGGTNRTTVPTVDDVMLHLRDYSLYFDDVELLMSPVCKSPSEDLKPILGVSVDQKEVFYEPRISASKM